MNKIKHFCQVFLFLLFVIHVDFLQSQTIFWKNVSGKGYARPRGPKITEIPQFQDVPYGEGNGLVIDVRTLNLPTIPDAYNPSIVKKGKNGYIIAFRYDLPWSGVGYKKVTLGLVETDLNFCPKKEPVLLDTGNDHSPDPRLFFHDGILYISYAHLTEWGSPYECCIGLSTIDLNTLSTQNNMDLLYKKGPREKNWIPFSYTNSEGKKELYFVYEFNPFTVVRVQKPITGVIEHPFAPDFSSKKGLDAWEKRWGTIRGGTPAILIDGEYVCFFHSSFQEKSLYWYVFGAITFESKPPFTVKRISSHPIFFKNIYQSSFAPQRNQLIRAIFPAGFVLDRKDHRDVLHVLCGENDSAIKIVTLDKKILLKSLQPVK